MRDLLKGKKPRQSMAAIGNAQVNSTTAAKKSSNQAKNAKKAKSAASSEHKAAKHDEAKASTNKADVICQKHRAFGIRAYG